MRRCFTYQLVVRGYVPQSDGDIKREASQLLDIANIVDLMLGHDRWVSTITHDEGSFHCFIGPEHAKALISIPRGCTALRWSIDEQRAFAELVAHGYRKRHQGPPLLDADGNRPRPAEETTLATGGAPTVPGRPRHG